MPKVSIITASYNYAKYIGKTIESVINQTFSDWEMLVVDDGSKDNSVDVINEYVQKDNRVKLLTHYNNENKGLVETLKSGISNAQGEYIVFLESDDYIREDYLEKKLKTFEKYTDVGFVYNDIKTFGAEQTLKRKLYFWLINHHWKTHNYPHDISEMLYLRNYVPTFSCVMLKKELLSNLNWESPDKACIDLWLWAQISQKTKFYYIQDKITFWRLHNDSYLNTSRVNYQILDFYENLYNILPPMKHLSTKLGFIEKQIAISLKYKRNVLKNIKHICKDDAYA